MESLARRHAPPTAMLGYADKKTSANPTLGKNRSDFMLEAACSAAQAVVLDQVFFSLDDDKFKHFTAMLDAPPSHNPGLERLMAVTAPWASDKA
jgi:uncharacterized protein (DUF1778 family)